MQATDIDINEVATKLAAPFSPEQIKFRIDGPVQDSAKKPGTHYARIVCYIDARDVQDRLNAVCGFNWSSHLEQQRCEKGYAYKCQLTIFGVSREDVGYSDTSPKDAASDALKRVGVHFQIARDLYRAGNMFAETEQKGKNWYIKASEERRLRAMF